MKMETQQIMMRILRELGEKRTEHELIKREEKEQKRRNQLELDSL